MASLVETISVKGFKSISSIQNLELKAINVLVGANGSGKSNFIGLFSFLGEIRSGRLQEYVVRSGGAEKVLHFGSKNTPRLEIDLSFANRVNGYQLWLGANSNDSLFPVLEEVSFWGDKKKYSSPYTESVLSVGRGLEVGISSSNVQRTARWVRDYLGSWRLYHVHDTSTSSPMRKTSNIEDNKFLRSDGSNLAAFLYLLKEQENESYQLIRHAVRQVAPFFEDFNLAPSKLNPEAIRLEWRHKTSDEFFDSSSFSDGTLRFITLATLLLQPLKFRPSLILVDEPELGLHPFAIELLSSLIRQASKKTQVLIATQSAQLLDNFEPEDILVANRVDGGTKVSRLDSERLSSWLEEYSLGQLWEKNEFAGRPSPD